jgi:hypothetical protein
MLAHAAPLNGGVVPIDFPKLLTAAETAKLLLVTTGTLAVWRCTRRYPLPYVKLGHAIRYREEDVRKFIEEQLR